MNAGCSKSFSFLHIFQRILRQLNCRAHLSDSLRRAHRTNGFALRESKRCEVTGNEKEKKSETKRLGNKFLIAFNFSSFFVRSEYKGGGSN